MRTATINIYTFGELSAKAKDRAKYDYQANMGYTSADEGWASLEGLVKHFDGRIADYSIDYFATSHSFARFDMPEMERDEIADRLADLGTFNAETLKGHGDCKLTGYCIDEDAIDGFRIAFHGGESDLGALMEAAFSTWSKACQADCEAFYEYDEFEEHCDENDYEFYDNGEIA
jgi:hypothetical protein